MKSRIFRTLAPVVAALATVSLLAPASLRAQATSSLVTTRITRPIDDNSLVTLKGTVHPLANAKNDRGAAPDSFQLDRVQIVFKRSAAQESALQQLIRDQHTPGTANYHKWLTPAQFGQQFGPSDQDVATLEAWLQSKGFSINQLNAGKQTLEISGNVAQFRTAFHTQIHKYMVNGETHYANATNPEIPSAIAPVFAGFASLNNFRIKKQARVLGKALYDPKTGTAQPQWTVGPGGGALNNSYVLSPADFYTQYDLNPLYSAGTTGSGQTIAIINDSNINVNLVNLFRTTFNIAQPTNIPQVIIDGNDPGIDGVNNPDGPNYDSDEAYLDVEWSGAVAPAATVDLVIGADTALESGLILAAEHAVYGNIAPVMSISFGECEVDMGSENAFLDTLWEQAAAQGITVMVSAGDNGSAGCDDDNTQYYAVGGAAVSGFASTPFNVAVGGTDFYYSSYNQGTSAQEAQIGTYWNTTPSNSAATASIKSPIPEQPWNDSQYGLNIFSLYNSNGTTTIAGGSGGASAQAVCSVAYSSDGTCSGTLTGYAKPAWQTGTNVPADKVRDLPDVSLFAADGLNDSYYPFCYADGDCQPSTSGSTIQVSGGGGTSFASPAFAGIMALVNQKYGRQGQADYVLYPLAAQYPAAFHDVTVGNNSVPCNTTTVEDSSGNLYAPTDCIAVSNPLTVTDPTYGETTEGRIGTGSTPEYNAGTGYDLASGLGSVDANVLVSDWGNVKFTSSSVNLTSPTAGTSITHGSSVTFTGTVTGTGSATPTGDVSIQTDSTEPVNQAETFFTLSSGAFTGSLNYLPGGTYDVWANYGGDSTNASAQSSKVQITVNPEASSVYFNLLDVGVTQSDSVAVNPGSSVPYGTQAIAAAQVYPTTYYSQCVTNQNPPASCSTATFGYPTGTVTFSDSGKTINTAVVNAEGDAEYNAPWSVGSHSVTAKYSGDNSYTASSGSAIAFTVVKATPSIYLNSAATTSTGSIVGGQSTAITIQVENTSNGSSESNYEIGYSVPVAPPTGTITISGLPSGIATSATLSPAVDPSDYFATGVATLIAPSSVKAGTYNVTIAYSGDSNYNSTSQSGTVTIVANTGLTSTIAATTVPSNPTSTSPTQSITVTGTVTGQSGKAAPTGGVIVYSSGNIVTELQFSSSSGDTSTFSTTLNSQALFQGANFVTLQYTGDSVYAASSTTLNNNTAISNPLSDFSMVPEATIVPVTAGSSATDTINLSSINGFTGTVNYTCTAASGVTCSLSPSSNTFTSNGTSSTTLTINAGSSAATGNYNVMVTGTNAAGTFTHTLGIQATVTSTSTTPGFTLTNGGNITVTAGSSGTSVITVTPTNGFTGKVALACTPSSTTTGVACSLSSSSVTISGTTAQTSTLTVTTTSSSAALHTPLEKLFAAGGGVVLAGLLFFGIPARRRSWKTILALLLFAGIAGFGIGCGSSNGGSSGGGSASYTVTVTGTSGSLSNPTAVSVTVNQ